MAICSGCFFARMAQSIVFGARMAASLPINSEGVAVWMAVFRIGS